MKSTLIEVNINFADNILTKFLKQSSNAPFQSKAAERHFTQRMSYKKGFKKTPERAKFGGHTSCYGTTYTYFLRLTYLTDICRISKKMLESIIKHCYK